MHLVCPNIPHQEITYQIIGAAMRVHNRLTPRLKERHYQRDLTAKMREVGLQVLEEHHLAVYDGDRWSGRRNQLVSPLALGKKEHV